MIHNLTVCKGLKLGIKVLEKALWSGQEKKKKKKHPLEVGVQQGSQESHGYQQLLPAPWPCKRLKPLSDHQTGNIPV